MTQRQQLYYFSFVMFHAVNPTKTVAEWFYFAKKYSDTQSSRDKMLAHTISANRTKHQVSKTGDFLCEVGKCSALHVATRLVVFYKSLGNFTDVFVVFITRSLHNF